MHGMNNTKFCSDSYIGMLQRCETVQIILEYFLYTAPSSRRKNTAAQYEARKPNTSYIVYHSAHAPSRFTFLSLGSRVTHLQTILSRGYRW